MQVCFHSGSSQQHSIPPTPSPVTTLNFDQTKRQPTESSSQESPQQLLSLWDWYSQQQRWSLYPPPLSSIGSFALAAKLQSDADLSPGSSSLSGSLIRWLGMSQQGGSVSVCQSDRTHAVTAQVDSKPVIYMRMMLDQNTGKQHTNLRMYQCCCEALPTYACAAVTSQLQCACEFMCTSKCNPVNVPCWSAV